ncbi:MAG: SixA phosphatase family protein [Opitutales bacterium]
MRLFLLRHAEAAPGLPDAERALTKRGRGQIEKLVESLDWSCLADIRSIEHSGLVRARQTAEDLAKLAALRVPLAIRSGMRPTDDPRIMARDVVTSREDRLLVGHNPHLARLAGILLGAGTSEVSLVLKKCGFLALERAEPVGKELPLGRWRLLWLISPGRLSDDDE